MNYCSRTKHESTAFPGVTFTIHKMTERRRVKRELIIAPLRQRVNEDGAAVRAAMDDESLPKGTADRLNREFGNFLTTEWYPAWLRWGLYAIEGFQLNDVDATVEDMCGEDAPDDLVAEILKAIYEASGITVTEQKNSPEPSSSEDREDGKASDTTAPSAKPLDGGKTETAASSSPAT